MYTFFKTLIDFREGKRTREKERNIDWLPLVRPDQYWTCNLGMCPDQASNLQPFGLQDDVPTKWATPERLQYHIFNYIFHFSKLFMLPVLKRQTHDVEKWNYLFPAYPSPNSLSPKIIIFNSFSLCVWGVMWLPPNF